LKILLTLSLLYITISCLCITPLHAQLADQETIVNGEQYLSSRGSSLDKYLKRSGCIQQKLLKQQRHQEAHLAWKLADNDSVRYAQYKNIPLTYNSIAARSADTTLAKIQPGAKATIINSLELANKEAVLDQQQVEWYFPGGLQFPVARRGDAFALPAAVRRNKIDK
jgi:hypothetical protein